MQGTHGPWRARHHQLGCGSTAEGQAANDVSSVSRQEMLLLVTDLQLMRGAVKLSLLGLLLCARHC